MGVHHNHEKTPHHAQESKADKSNSGEVLKNKKVILLIKQVLT